MLRELGRVISGGKAAEAAAEAIRTASLSRTALERGDIVSAREYANAAEAAAGRAVAAYRARNQFTASFAMQPAMMAREAARMAREGIDRVTATPPRGGVGGAGMTPEHSAANIGGGGEGAGSAPREREAVARALFASDGAGSETIPAELPFDGVDDEEFVQAIQAPAEVERHNRIQADRAAVEEARVIGRDEDAQAENRDYALARVRAMDADEAAAATAAARVRAEKAAAARVAVFIADTPLCIDYFEDAVTIMSPAINTVAQTGLTLIDTRHQTAYVLDNVVPKWIPEPVYNYTAPVRESLMSEVPIGGIRVHVPLIMARGTFSAVEAVTSSVGTPRERLISAGLNTLAFGVGDTLANNLPVNASSPLLSGLINVASSALLTGVSWASSVFWPTNAREGALRPTRGRIVVATLGLFGKFCTGAGLSWLYKQATNYDKDKHGAAPYYADALVFSGTIVASVASGGLSGVVPGVAAGVSAVAVADPVVKVIAKNIDEKCGVLFGICTAIGLCNTCDTYMALTADREAFIQSAYGRIIKPGRNSYYDSVFASSASEVCSRTTAPANEDYSWVESGMAHTVSLARDVYNLRSYYFNPTQYIDSICSVDSRSDAQVIWRTLFGTTRINIDSVEVSGDTSSQH
jgi:hypothetical protein